VARDYRVPLDRDADGRPEDYYFNFVYHPLVAADGQVSGLIAVSTEVTDSVRARREAEAARERTDAVLGSIADAFYLLDREWRFTHVNDAAEPLLQTTRDRLLGRTLWEAFPGVIGSVFEGPYREAMATGRVTAAEAYFPPLGTWFDVRTYPWAGGLMVHFRDIGARKTAEAERERLLADAHAARAEAEAARTRAEAASRAKSEFLAVMSHELRTPLNAIGGYAELMELGIRGPVTNEQRDDLARIQRSQRALLGLINEVLNYARLDAGAVTYDVTDVPVAEAVGAAEVLIAPQLRAKGLGYTWAGAAPGLAVRADRDKLQQVLLNLLSNAIKFTNARAGLPGRVEVSCEAVEAAGVTDATVRIQVRDTGVGIPANQLGRVFEPFVQVDQGLTRTHEGTGLGLAISRDLARGMGGDLTAESTPGAGSTFTHTLPSA
jgi:signal transduction histidine kinase